MNKVQLTQELKDATDFSTNGNEVAFGTIGNASSAEVASMPRHRIRSCA